MGIQNMNIGFAMPDHMPHEWLIRTLEEVHDYARAHGLSETALALEDCKLLAFTEAATQELCLVDPMAG